jgi:aminomethyltransferase
MEEESNCKKIPLNDLHESLGGKMTPFAGYYMPVRYSGDIEEHNCVRNGVGVFDVSHMGEFLVEGEGALAFIQKITSNDASVLQPGKIQYTCFPNPSGGIIDDLLVYMLAENKYMLVVNASNIEKDWNWIVSNNAGEAKLTNISEQTVLFAVQGPDAEKTLQKLTSLNLSELSYYSFAYHKMANLDNVLISATGYTGAGGFELYTSRENALALWNAIFDAGAEFAIKPIGLGARDTLRLEMGFCLYGNEINDTISPLEAGLGWITKFNKTFIASDLLQKQKEKGVEKKLIAFELTERGIPRTDYGILNTEGENIGYVTSGTMSPTLGKGIGLGYVQYTYAKTDQNIFISIRNKPVSAKIVKLPFIKK